MTEKEAKKEIMRQALKINPTVYIGKYGFKNSVCDEIRNQLKKNRLIKMKILPSVKDESNEIIDSVARTTQSIIVDVRGSIAIMTDKKTWKSLCQKKLSGFNARY